MARSLGQSPRLGSRGGVAHAVHALEEMGEVARLVLQWEGYKDAENPEKLHTELEEELSDVFVFLFKLAYQTGVDVEAALAPGRRKLMGAMMMWRRPARCWPATTSASEKRWRR